ncbi:hypothetical protein C8R47DRAFT_1137019 [Mycena vitilis]|nr:hypothetical protein C8R47DRAFT_1137019 [Mycena vitilis]
MHNSAERPPDPACHPGTRETVLDTLRAWSRDDSPEARLLWLHGSAGMGKSAIAQAFAAERQEDGSLGASFFFRRGDRGRGNWKSLFPTLAYQLAASFPQLRDALKQAVESDKLVFGQAMRHQFAKLAIAPFERSPTLAVRPIVVMDGLDECEDHSDQVMLLNLIIGGLRAGTFPVRFLIASRPEAHLRELLQATANFDVCRHLELRSDDSADADIHRYLCDEFQRIRKCHISRGIPLENGWPEEDALNRLVTKSSGTFIYATTVVRYVDEEYSHPTERLESVLALDPYSTAPLDSLYTQIISAIPDRSTLRRVLHAVVKNGQCWDPEEIDCVLQLRAGTSRLVLQGLHSILSVSSVRTMGLRYPVKLLHASLGDFLRDSARSSDLCIAPPELDYALVRTMTKCLSSTPQDTLLFRVIATQLLEGIVRVSPAPNLLPILYDVGVQDAVCWNSRRFPPEIVEWLKNCTPPPSDLILVWEDIYYISQLHHLTDDPPLDSVGTEYDEMYTQVLSQNPSVLSALRVSSVWPGSQAYPVAWGAWGAWGAALAVLGLNWDALRPLCALKVPRWILERSLRGFLQNPGRAGILYSAPQEIHQFTALCCISRIRRVFLDSQLHKIEETGTWLGMVSLCPPSDLVSRELEHLNLAQLCVQLQVDAEYHFCFHKYTLRPDNFKEIVDWLRRFPSPPLQTISFWEQQLAAVEACCQRLFRRKS